MVFFGLIGMLIILVAIVIAVVIFFVIRRDERKAVDRNEDILDS